MASIKAYGAVDTPGVDNFEAIYECFENETEVVFEDTGSGQYGLDMGRVEWNSFPLRPNHIIRGRGTGLDGSGFRGIRPRQDPDGQRSRPCCS